MEIKKKHARTVSQGNKEIEEAAAAIRKRLNSPKRVDADVRIDTITRKLYSTDASIYQWEPLGVVFPRHLDDLQAIVEVCAEYRQPVIARGSGTSLAGQAIGPAWIIDCTRHLNKIVEINPEESSIWVEPGLILNTLNIAAKRYGLQFGPDPASAERATLGGSVANNATGAHSIVYGMAADHILAAEIVFADGKIGLLEELTETEAAHKAASDNGYETQIYRSVLEIRRQYTDAIKKHWPQTWRKASGYNLNYLIPWSPSSPPGWMQQSVEIPYPPISIGSLNLATLMAGSEGTLGVFSKLKLRLVELPKKSILIALSFSDLAEACSEVPDILETHPAAIELIPENLIRQAESIAAYAPLARNFDPLFGESLDPNRGRGAAMLVVEYWGDTQDEVEAKAKRLGKNRPHLIARTAQEQAAIWAVRKVGLGLFLSRPGDEKPWSFIEDLSVPVEKLGEFVQGFQEIMREYEVECEYYGHASAGCLHIRPVINLKTIIGVRSLRNIARAAVGLTIGLGGAVSGEHGDGLARSEWNVCMFGPEVGQAFRQLKQAADPNNLLNPGKIVAINDTTRLPAMDEHLRYGAEYRSNAWQPIMGFSSQGQLEGAIEQCNGAGVCRKSEGPMCPSFQATGEELHSTRGRANLLRLMISGQIPDQILAEKAVFEALDLCLACKACRAECPSRVDMAKLKYEFLAEYYKQHTRKLRDYLFGYIGLFAKIGQPLWWLANPLINSKFIGSLFRKALDLSPKRKFPEFAREKLSSQWNKVMKGQHLSEHYSISKRESDGIAPGLVLLLNDPFTEYFEPQIGMAAYRVLAAFGFEVRLIPVIGAGRPLISKGFLKPARKHAKRMLDAIYQIDREGRAVIVAIEPSELQALIDEYPDLLPNDRRAYEIADRVCTAEELLLNSKIDISKMRVAIPFIKTTNHTSSPKKNKVFLHEHCYQQARLPFTDQHIIGGQASKKLLEKFGYEVNLIPAGCCGMAGAFGYEKEHYELSMQVGELRVFPAVRAAGPDAVVASAGTSCRAQIKGGLQKSTGISTVFHPIEIIYQTLLSNQATDQSQQDATSNHTA